VLSAPGPRHIHTKRCIIRSISSLNTADSPCFLCGVGAGNGVVEKIISNFKLLSQAISVIKILTQKSFLVCYPTQQLKLVIK